MTPKETASPAANKCVHSAALQENFMHGDRLQRSALARLQHLDTRLMPFGKFLWNRLDPKDPRTLTPLRHVARWHRARAQTAHAIKIHQQTLALVLQRIRAKQIEEGPITLSDQIQPEAACNPSCLSTAETATQILALMKEANKALSESVMVVKENCEQEEFHRFRRHAGVAMGEIFVEIMKPIFKEHPELIPEELK